MDNVAANYQTKSPSIHEQNIHNIPQNSIKEFWARKMNENMCIIQNEVVGL